MLLFAPEKGNHDQWRPPKAIDQSFNTSATGEWRFGAAIGLPPMAMAIKPEQTPRGSEGCLFASNVLYFVVRLKNYARKTTNQRVAKKFATYYVPYVSFVSKSACNQNPAMNPAMNPPPNQASRQNFFTKLSGNLS